MFENSVVILSGDNKSFNNTFLKRFYNKIKEVRLLTSDIFDKSYDKYEKIKLYPNNRDLEEAIKNCDFLFHYVGEELTILKNFSINDDYFYNTEKLLKTILKTSTLSRAIFLSDGRTSISNDKMIKNLVVKYAKKSQNTAINYLLVKDSSVEELIDTMIFTSKNTNNGDIFVKKVKEKKSLKQKLKSLLNPKTKIEEARESFFTSSEMARMVDYGKYYKISLENENYKLNIFADRLKTLSENKEELEEAY